MKVNDLASRFFVATLEGMEVGVAHRTDLLVKQDLPRAAQQIYSGLNEAQAEAAPRIATANTPGLRTNDRPGVRRHRLGK